MRRERPRPPRSRTASGARCCRSPRRRSTRWCCRPTRSSTSRSPSGPTEDETVDGGNAHVWDPLTNTTTSVPPPVDVRPGSPSPAPARRRPTCGARARPRCADGRVLVVGGNLEYPINGGIGAGNGFKGGKWVMTFDPWTETWTRYADMPHGRWYPTLTELPDGRVLIVGGWDETGGRQGPGRPGRRADAWSTTRTSRSSTPSTPPGGQATTVVSQLPPEQPGPAEPRGPTTATSASTRTCSCCPTPRRSGTAATRCWWRDPASTTRRSSTPARLDLDRRRRASAAIPDTGQPRLSSDRSWGTAWLEPSGPDGSTRVVLLGGSDAGRPGARPGHRPAAARHRRGPRPRRPRPRLAARPRADAQRGPRALQHRPAARRVDLHQRRRLRPHERHPLRRPGLPARSSHARRRGRLARRRRRGRRAHLPLDRGAAARRPGGVGRRRPRHRPQPEPGNVAGHIRAGPHGPDLEPALPVRRRPPGGHLRPAERALRRPLPRRGRRATPPTITRRT